MNTNKPSDSLIFLLIDDTTSAPNFKTQEEIEEYFGEPVSFTLEEIEVIYSLEDKYYSIIYRSNLYEEDELISESVEVKPIQETVTKFIKI